MKIQLPLPIASALFNELKAQDPSGLTAAQSALLDELREYCQENQEWHPTGRRHLPTIRGLGWMVYFNESATDSDQAETTLWDRELDRYYVLVGDHREAYKHAAPEGFNALYNCYSKLNDAPGFRSDDTYTPRGPNDSPLRD